MAVVSVLLQSATAEAQHLWWNLDGIKDPVCLFGEVTVLASHSSHYYCGANWHPGEPAGGYCGIQHINDKSRLTIFSVWDTSKELKPSVTHANPRTVHRRFGGEGTGAHTHMDWPWVEGEAFQFFVQKKPGSQPKTTDARYFVFDRPKKQWLHSATITSPTGGHRSVETLGGGLNSFLENFGGRDPAVAKLALYRLWAGRSLDAMKCLTRAQGDGTWGQLGDAYFLAAGDQKNLDAAFARWEKTYGKPESGKGKQLNPISNKPLPEPVVKALGKALSEAAPKADAAK